ncbi:MAG: peptidoglycan editing factor PgeF [Bacteroidetes bacterium]|nr:MAG: peptidoglycan editing factor PgeF [Bacteroidota bacterium]PTM14806.1 MAG: peptidoglycan editing factor PgeF [Bacteroidota bacterium]
MPITFDQPAWAHPFADRLIAAQSTRLGGVSQAPFAALNLGLHTADDPGDVARNREIFCQDLGCSVSQLAGAHQVHGDQVLRVQHPGQWTGYDALITNRKGVVLTVTIADCVPILIFDPVHDAVGAAHAGWRGTVAGIAEKTLRQMGQAFGTQAKDCWAWVGTCIGALDFAVDADVADHFPRQHKTWDEEKGKFFVDLKKANREQLINLQLPATQLTVSPYSTVADRERYFSHRAEQGQTGRMLAVIGLRG